MFTRARSRPAATRRRTSVSPRRGGSRRCPANAPAQRAVTGGRAIQGRRRRPWRIALSRFPQAAIEHQRRVPGRVVSRNQRMQWGFAQPRMRSPRWSSSSTSAAAHVHGTRQALAATTSYSTPSGVSTGWRPPRASTALTASIAGSLRPWAGAAWASPAAGSLRPWASAASGVAGRGLAAGRGRVRRRGRRPRARCRPGRVRRRGRRPRARCRPGERGVGVADCRAARGADARGRVAAGRLGVWAGRRGVAIATHAPGEQERAQRLARVEQRAPRRGVGGRVEAVLVQPRTHAGLVGELVAAFAVGDPGRVQEIEGERFAGEWSHPHQHRGVSRSRRPASPTTRSSRRSSA